MTESQKAGEPEWSGLNLPILTEVVEEQAVPTLAEEAEAEAPVEVPEFDFSSELDTLAAQLEHEGGAEPELEIPELTLDELLATSKPADSSTDAAGGLDFSNLPSLELSDADSLAGAEGLDFVLEPRAEPQAGEADGLAALMARAELQVREETPQEVPEPAAETGAEISWGDVVEAASELAPESPSPFLTESVGPAATFESSLPACEPTDSEMAASAGGSAEVAEQPEPQAASAESESAGFTSISLDSLPSGVLGGGVGREPAPSSGLEWLSNLPSQQPPAEPPKPTVKEMIAEAERVLAEERAKQAAANRAEAEAFGMTPPESVQSSAEETPATALASQETAVDAVLNDLSEASGMEHAEAQLYAELAAESPLVVEAAMPTVPDICAESMAEAAAEQAKGVAEAELPVDPDMPLTEPGPPLGSAEPVPEQTDMPGCIDAELDGMAPELAADIDLHASAERASAGRFVEPERVAEPRELPGGAPVLPADGIEPAAEAGESAQAEEVEAALEIETLPAMPELDPASTVDGDFSVLMEGEPGPQGEGAPVSSVASDPIIEPEPGIGAFPVASEPEPVVDADFSMLTESESVPPEEEVAAPSAELEDEAAQRAEAGLEIDIGLGAGEHFGSLAEGELASSEGEAAMSVAEEEAAAESLPLAEEVFIAPEAVVEPMPEREDFPIGPALQPEPVVDADANMLTDGEPVPQPEVAEAPSVELEGALAPSLDGEPEEAPASGFASGADGDAAAEGESAFSEELAESFVEEEAMTGLPPLTADAVESSPESGALPVVSEAEPEPDVDADSGIREEAAASFAERDDVAVGPQPMAVDDVVQDLYDAVPQPAPLEDEDLPALSGLLGRGVSAPAATQPEPQALAEPQTSRTQNDATAEVSVLKVAAMSSAAAGGKPSPQGGLDEQALFNSLYEQMLPRMKVELSLWLQDAIEVQAKQMLSGMMHQLKEDYEMLFGDALKESLRQALSDNGGVRKPEEGGNE
ncbi:hypothetical protein [Chromobacterium phragmitis]|uniref:Uncharacterized protein n=2 Tax=Chromobacterium phragmitis TaxID=2202141 RepID=A0ABV0IN58_9NEIS